MENENPVYKNVWAAIFNKVVETRMEPENPTEKFAVCVLKEGHIK